MNGPEILHLIRHDLQLGVARQGKPPALQPLPISPWLAMALLQKSIRRGRTDLASRATETLLVDAPDKLWRRCGGIALEDIGVGDPNLLGLVVASLGGKRVRADLGGEWSVASCVVEALSRANTCRSADDLLMGVGWRWCTT